MDCAPVAERLFLDLIRMVANEVETRTMPVLFATQGRKRNVRKLLKTLFTDEASIVLDLETGTLTVHILSLGNDSHDLSRNRVHAGLRDLILAQSSVTRNCVGLGRPNL